MHVVLLRFEVLDPCGEAARETEHRGVLEVAALHAPVVGRLIDDGEAQRMVEVLVVELRAPLECAGLAEGRAQRQRAARVIVAARVAGGDAGRIGLARVDGELVARQRAGKILVVVDLAHVEPHRGATADRVAETRVEAMTDLIAVLAVPLQLGVRVARVEIEWPVHLTGRHMVLQEAERARLAADAEQAFVVPGLGHEVDGAAERESTEAECVGALVDLDPLGGEELERLEVAEAVGLSVDEAVEQHVDAAQVEIVA